MKVLQHGIIAVLVSLIAVMIIATAMPQAAYAETARSQNPSRIVGKLTIMAYPGSPERWMPHGYLELTAYENIDLNACYYKYYKPTDKYTSILVDYLKKPEKYRFDPALYNKNILNIDDRESYFDVRTKEPYAGPEKISLKAGEGIGLSSAGYGDINIDVVIEILEDSTAASDEDVAEFIRQLRYYREGSELFDFRKVTKKAVKSALKAYKEAITTGHNPIDGRTVGGICLNREIQDQFVGVASRMPNNYYSVEITARELENLNNFISDPTNNFFSFFDRNCTYTATRMWNATLKDRPWLFLNSNITGFSVEPESLFVELGILRQRSGLGGEGGRNHVPRTLVFLTDENQGGDPDVKPAKKANTLKLTAKKTQTAKYKTLKKKSVKLEAKKLMTVSGGVGTKSYKLVSVNKSKSKFSVNAKNGALTIKKGTKKGLYKVKVQVKAAGSSTYLAASKTVTVKVRVR